MAGDHRKLVRAAYSCGPERCALAQSGTQRVEPMTGSGDGHDRLRSGLGAVLGACIALLPFLVGRMDLATTLTMSAIGAVGILPVWRHAGTALKTPGAVIAFFGLLVGPIVIAKLFSALAGVSYIGGWATALGLARFLADWRDDY